ncbi:hypothetical protein ACFL2C_03745 [Patescibacteria group bacterium]
MNRNDNSAARAGVLGAVLGMMAGATIVFLSDARNRSRIREGLNQMDSDARKQLDDLKASVGSASVQTKKLLAKNLKTFANQLESGK